MDGEKMPCHFRQFNGPLSPAIREAEFLGVPTVIVPYQSPPLTRSHPRLVEVRSIDGEG